MYYWKEIVAIKKQGLCTCSWGHLQQDTQWLCPERLCPLGAQVGPGAGLGGASLLKHNISAF